MVSDDASQTRAPVKTPPPLPSKSSAALQTSVLTQLYPDPAGSICMQATPKKRIPLLHPLEGNTAAAAAAP